MKNKNELGHADWVFQAAGSITQIYEGDIYDDAKATGNLGNALSRAVFVYSSVYHNGQKTPEAITFIRDHVKKYGPLSPEAMYYLMRLSQSCGFSEIEKERGRAFIKLHRSHKKHDEFSAWVKSLLQKGISPKPCNLSGIKRLTGFKKTWGTDVTIRKWWAQIDGAPKLQAGAPRSKPNA